MEIIMFIMIIQTLFNLYFFINLFMFFFTFLGGQDP